ncbi:transketolase [Suillus subluteus]|nr:transketolase [Suillus subluteus]
MVYKRVFNTPSTKQGIACFGSDLASMEHTAIADYMISPALAYDQLVNEAAKFCHRSGGHFSIGGPSVIPTQSFVEPKVLYRSESAVKQVPIDDFFPASKSSCHLTWGTLDYQCESTLRLLNSQSPSLALLIRPYVRSAKVELIDLRTILPWDIETVVKSMRRTKRLVIVHEAGMTSGVGGEIAADVRERVFLRLEAPVRRITGWVAMYGWYNILNLPGGKVTILQFVA